MTMLPADKQHRTTHRSTSRSPHTRLQVVLKGEHLLQFDMARDSSDAALHYPTRYLAEDNVTLEVNIRLNRYVTQTQVGQCSK